MGGKRRRGWKCRKWEKREVSQGGRKCRKWEEGKKGEKVESERKGK